jgi:transcriptional regulator with XRE-family HTH domain
MNAVHEGRRRRTPETIAIPAVHYGPGFAELITPEKKKRGMTQKQLARKSGVPLSRIQRYEHGTRDPGLVDLTRLAHSLGLDPLELFTRTLEKAGLL